MQSPAPTNALQVIQTDLEQYIHLLEVMNNRTIQLLKEFHQEYLAKGDKPFFREKMGFEKFLNAICFNTRLVVYDAMQHNVPFSHVRPKEYMWKLKDKKLAKLTRSEMNNEFKYKCQTITLNCVEMFYLSCIVESLGTIKRIGMYGENFLIDQRIANLHEHALRSIARMNLYGIK